MIERLDDTDILASFTWAMDAKELTGPPHFYSVERAELSRQRCDIPG